VGSFRDRLWGDFVSAYGELLMAADKGPYSPRIADLDVGQAETRVYDLLKRVGESPVSHGSGGSPLTLREDNDSADRSRCHVASAPGGMCLTMRIQFECLVR